MSGAATTGGGAQVSQSPLLVRTLTVREQWEQFVVLFDDVKRNDRRAKRKLGSRHEAQVAG